MKKPKSVLMSGHDAILYAQALAVRINLLESAFHFCNKEDKKQFRLLLYELGTAYSALMNTHDATKQFIQITTHHD
jgi:hypothetical protein